MYWLAVIIASSQLYVFAQRLFNSSTVHLPITLYAFTATIYVYMYAFITMDVYHYLSRWTFHVKLADYVPIAGNLPLLLKLFIEAQYNSA